MTLHDVFVWPEALPVLLAAPLVWLLLHALDRARRRRTAQLLGARRGETITADLSSKRRRLRRTAFTVGVLLALVAALQPAWGESTRDVEQRGVDLVVCLDVSRSMLARDAKPDRLESARQEIRALAERARGDRLALVAFAGEARLVAPLTRDVGSFLELVDRTDVLAVERGGTDLGAALDVALEALRGRTGDHEAVLLLTDGEDIAERGRDAAERCAERRITVHCAGFGSERGSKINVASGGAETYLRDRAGSQVVTALDSTSLRRIAEATGGAFATAGGGAPSLVTLYEDRIAPMARMAFESERRRGRESRHQWPLAGAFLLWILDLCLTDRRQR